MVEFTHVGPEAAASDAEVPTPKPAPAISTAGVVVVDSLNRQLTLRELTFLQEMDLRELAGGNRSDNAEWMTFVMLSAQVASIDAAPVPFPKNEPTLRAMLQRVDRAGVLALINYFAPPDQDTKPVDEEAQAKN